MSRNVIGIGSGSLNTVVGTFKDRDVDVVLSDSSNRQVPTVVSYNDRERNFGDFFKTKFFDIIARSSS